MPASAVTARPGSPAPEGTVASIDAQQIVVRPIDPGEPLRRYGWHEIQSIDGLGDEYHHAAEIGRRIWHSQLRLDRDDWPSAEALLEPLELSMRDSEGPTSVAFYTALLRIRLARLDRAAAAQAWLRGQAAGNSETPIDPNLGPFYFRLQGPVAARESWGESELARIHAAAITWASGPPGGRAALGPVVDAIYETTSESATDVRLAATCLAAYAGSSPTQTTARQELAETATDDASYRGVWARYAIARSKALDAETNQARLGVAELLGVSLRDERAAPLLAGLALAEATQVANRIKDPIAARVLATEFRRRFPAHPADRTIPASLSPPQGTTENTP